MWSKIVRWLSEQSLHRHLATLPLGTLLTTWLLLAVSDAGAKWWSKSADLTTAGQAVPLGAVLYGSSVLLLDGGVKLVFYALAQRRKEIEKRHREGRRQLLQELIDKDFKLPEDLKKEAEELGLTIPVHAGD